MPHRDPEAAELPHRVELRAEHFDRGLRRGDAHQVIEGAGRHVLVVVVDGRGHRELDERAPAVVEDERHVVGRQRRVVVETGFDEQVEGALTDAVVGRAVTAGPLAAHALDERDAPLERVPLLGLRLLVRPLVQVAVVGDLVARLHDALHGIRVALDDPARHEEGERHFVVPEQVHQARHRDQRVVAHVGEAVKLLVHGARVVEVHGAVGVHVEAERHRAARTVRPGRRVLDHRCVLMFVRAGLPRVRPASGQGGGS